MTVSPFAVYLVDLKGVRRFITRRQRIQDAADLGDILLHGTRGRIVEICKDAPGGAVPVSVIADPPRLGRRKAHVNQDQLA